MSDLSPGDGGPSPAPPRVTRETPHPLLLTLVVLSLLGNAILAIRYRHARSEIADLRARAAVASASPSASPSPTPTGTITDAGVLGEIQAAVERFRGLRFTKQVHTELLTTEQLRARVEADFKKNDPRADLDHTGAVLQTFGVIPADMSLYDELLKLETEQIAGYYDDKTKQMVIASQDAQAPTPLDRVLLAHEYTHALTDQHFDLGRLDSLQSSTRDDRAGAFQALAEGDAEFVRQAYQSQDLTASEQQQLQSDSAALPQTAFSSAPQFLQQELLFPYVHGLEFVTALRKSGGNAAVDAAYRDPPNSTEQILHPTRYIGGKDNPTPVTLPDARAKLGSGWTKIDGAELGEFDLRMILDQYLDTATSIADAAGWDGGEYAGYSSNDGTVVIAETAWDSQGEASQAVGGLKQWLPLRFGNAGAAFTVSGQDGAGWEKPSGSGPGASGAGEVVRSGARVLMILGPTRSDVERARSAVSGF